MTLAFASFKDFKLFQMNVKSAFLNGFIEEEVYVEQPLGFVDPTHLDFVFKLENALYCLKQMKIDLLALKTLLKTCIKTPVNWRNFTLEILVKN